MVTPLGSVAKTTGDLVQGLTSRLQGDKVMHLTSHSLYFSEFPEFVSIYIIYIYKITCHFDCHRAVTYHRTISLLDRLGSHLSLENAPPKIKFLGF